MHNSTNGAAFGKSLQSEVKTWKRSAAWHSVLSVNEEEMSDEPIGVCGSKLERF